MGGEFLFLAGVLAVALSGLPGISFSRKSAWGERFSALLCVGGCVGGIAGVLDYLATGTAFSLQLPAPIHDVQLLIGMDAISAVFLLPIFVVSGLGSIYGLAYWKQAEHPENGRRLRFFYGVLAAALAMLVVAQDSVSFLFAWEVMAVAAFFLVATEDADPEVMKAAWLYVAISHVATLALFGMFALMYSATGTFAFTTLRGIAPGLAGGIFILGLVGFGTKAGIMPFHIWLPSAHAMAPSHISALLSGVVIKMGIYGLVRVTSLFPDPPLWWGNVMIVTGAITGVLGIAFAMGQHDVKRLLAYSSIENIGIISIGLGLALIGRSLHQSDWVALGLAGVLLHVWNHAAFKSLLFFSVGSLVHATHTRQLDQLGGVGRRMRFTSSAFLIGALAICGLPPLNGFVSELLIFLGLFQTLGIDGGTSYGLAAFAAPALAIVGAMAVACYVKLFGIVFLGKPRSERAAHAHESPIGMLLPIGTLCAICLTIGLAPQLVTPVIGQAVASWQHFNTNLEGVAPFGWISIGNGILLLLLGGIGLILWIQLRRGPVTYAPTWGCGYLGTVTRGQYTSSSFAQMLVDLFRWVMWPRKTTPKIEAFFPKHAAFASDVPDTVLDRGVVPATRFLYRGFAWSRVLHQGNVQAYLLFVFATVILLLIWS